MVGRPKLSKREKWFNERDVFSDFEEDFDKKFNNRNMFSNFEQDFVKSFFHELKSTACLQHNWQHVFDVRWHVSAKFFSVIMTPY